MPPDSACTVGRHFTCRRMLPDFHGRISRSGVKPDPTRRGIKPRPTHDEHRCTGLPADYPFRNRPAAPPKI